LRIDFELNMESDKTDVPIYVTKSVKAVEAQEGDGARVKRSIGTAGLTDIDPFLMLDEFYVTPPAGFPSHPHRGFETVTYMLDGAFTHEDNKGHKGTIGPGDLQWMTAGRGIIHSEMPATQNVNHGLQLWVNLAAAHKMTDPQYQELLSKDIPEVHKDDVKVRIIAGDSCGVKASVYTRTPTMYLDISMKAGSTFVQDIPQTYKGFVYILSGEALFGSKETVGKESHCLVLSSGTSLTIKADKEDVRFVLLGGQPLNEPISKHGPFVMNTREEIQQAFLDYQLGRFAV